MIEQPRAGSRPSAPHTTHPQGDTVTSTAAQRQAQAILRNLYICFFVSGGLGLVYEILWLRKLLLVFGSTVHAVSTVLTVFFGGLALGSWLFGKLIDRHEAAGLRWYAALEAGVGLYALITLPLFDLLQHVYIPIYRASGFSPAALVAASFVCSALILIVPTTFLGGTFPVLSRFFVRSAQERGVTIASLYGINTAGAMVGVVFVYFVGLATLGLIRTLLCAAVLNLGIGMLCWTFDRHLQMLGFQMTPQAQPARSAAAEDHTPSTVRWLFAAFGLSGFSAMVYEVAWTRALSLVLGSSIYAFCIMLATFLGGMALGSLWARRTLRREPARVQSFVIIEMLLGLYGLGSILMFSLLPDWFVALWPLTAGDFGLLSVLQFVLSAFVMFLPTLLMGLLFPIVSDLVTQHLARFGQRLGSAYAINTVGGIVGSFLSGFVLIPLLGLPKAIMIAALANLAAAAIVFLCDADEAVSRVKRSVLAAASLAAAAVWALTAIIPLWQQRVLAAGVFINPGSYQRGSVAQETAQQQLLYYRDSLNTTVSVHQTANSLFLKVGGKTDASSGIDMGTQVLSAHIPLLLHRDPQRVLVIGLGSGVTLGHAGRHPVSTLHCAEIDEAVVEGARFFASYNYDVHEDPRTTIFVVDGRNFLLATPEHYDVIISEPSNPWMAGLGYLFTEEFYRLAKRRLAPGGLMCQWLQLYRLFPGDVKLVLKTFHASFPYVSVWSSIPGDILLIGSMEPQELAFDRLVERASYPAIREALSVVRIDRPELLLQLFRMATPEVGQLTASYPWLHQDDLPFLEFSAPKALYLDPAFTTNYQGFERFQSPLEAVVRGYDRAVEDAGFHYALGQVYGFRGEPQQAREAFERAVELEPTFAEAWMELGKLYAGARSDQQAREAFLRVADLDPRQAAAAYQLLGRLSWIQHDLDEAQRFYERSASLQAPNQEASEEIANCLQRNKELAWAAEYYRSSISQGGGGALWSDSGIWPDPQRAQTIRVGRAGAAVGPPTLPAGGKLCVGAGPTPAGPGTVP